MFASAQSKIHIVNTANKQDHDMVNLKTEESEAINKENEVEYPETAPSLYTKYLQVK